MLETRKNTRSCRVFCSRVPVVCGVLLVLMVANTWRGEASSQKKGKAARTEKSDPEPAEEIAQQRPQVAESITPAEAAELIKKNRDNPYFAVLDIRTREEYLSGHLENASNIDYYSESFKQVLDDLDKEMTYLIYCQSGTRTRAALALMKDLGFREVYMLKGGVFKWKLEGYPVSEVSGCGCGS
ncbi:MAG: rhodanese-like domain-containing protein [Spirochaetota bacterium]